jgi:alanine racemase
MARPLYAQINLAALRANLARVREKAPGTQVLAVVKANAYGHGLERVLPALEDADGLALVEPDAAIELREQRYTRRILLLEGFFAESELPEFAQRRLATVVHDSEQVRMLETTVLPRPLEVFVKVNTGMNRLGFRPAEVAGVCQRLSSSPSVAALRLMMHFARADEDDGLREPLAVFEAACRGLPYPRSIANSAGIVRFPEVGGDFVRAGIMLYGATPFPYDTAEMLGLQPVMTLRSSIIAVQDLKVNESVGYGALYTASRPHRVGVIACGYADGYPRHAPNGTPVLVCGKKVRLAGRPSMDMVTVDLTDVPEARVGSPVVLWGEGLPVDDIASAAATVGYELLCAVAPRVPHVTSEMGGVDLEL